MEHVALDLLAASRPGELPAAPEAAAYDSIVNIDYLQRPLLPAMKSALKIGGYIIFDTYLDRSTRRLAIQEILTTCSAITSCSIAFAISRVLYYREGEIRDRRCVENMPIRYFAAQVIFGQLKLIRVRFGLRLVVH